MMKNKEKIKKGILIYTLIIFLVFVLILPLISLFKEAFFRNGAFIGFNNFKEYFSNPVLFKSFKNSINVSFCTSFLVVIIGFIFSYGIERCKLKGKKILNFIAMLPLFVPTMTHAISLIYLLGENGVLSTGFFGRVEGFGFKFPLYGKYGVILGEFFYVFPAKFMMFLVALKSCDYRLYEVANVMSTSKIKKFFTITLPSVKYTLISAFLASFTMVFSDFGIPKVLGGNYNLLATDVYKQVIGQSNISMGATVGILLIIPSIISFMIDIKLSKSDIENDSKATKYRIEKNKIRDILIGSICYTITFIILVMIGAIFLAAFTKQWPYDLTFTLEWFNLKSTKLIYINTLFVAIMSAIIGTVIAVLISYSTQRIEEFKVLKKILDLFSIISLAIPGLLVGLSYLLFFNGENNPLRIIYGSFVIIILANVVHFISIPYITMKSKMKKIPSEYEAIGETIGVSWTSVFDDVIIPLSKDAIFETFSYIFLNSMMTVSAVVFLYSSKTKLASIEMIATYDEGFLATTAAIAILILITNIIVKYGISYFIDKKNEKN